MLFLQSKRVSVSPCKKFVILCLIFIGTKTIFAMSSCNDLVTSDLAGYAFSNELQYFSLNLYLSLVYLFYFK